MCSLRLGRGFSLPCIKICNIITLTADIENRFYRFEDIHKQILPAKLNENLTIPGGVRSILEAGSQQTRKLNQFPLVTSDFH